MNKKGNWSHIQKQKGHKSGLESRIDEQLQSQGIDGEYEQHEVSYTIPATHHTYNCLLYTSPSPRDKRQSRMPSSA